MGPIKIFAALAKGTDGLLSSPCHLFAITMAMTAFTPNSTKRVMQLRSRASYSTASHRPHVIQEAIMRSFTGTLLGLFLVVGFHLSAAAQDYPRWAGGNVQILGFDTTAYFKSGKPAAGVSTHTVKWQNGTWQFKNAVQAAKFRANPSAFTPQFGAYCTGGLSQQHVVNGHPKNWRIHNGRLYLFYSAAGARRFDGDPQGTIHRARAYARKVGIREN